MGVEFRRADVGRDVALADLERDYDFVFLGVGLGAMDRLGIPGESAQGVVDALRFIERYKTLPDFQVGRLCDRHRRREHGHRRGQRGGPARRGGRPPVLPQDRGPDAGLLLRVRSFALEGVQFHWLAQPVEIVERDGSPPR